MKRLIYTLGLLFSMFSINAVEIVNNTQKSIGLGNFVSSNYRLRCPFSLGSGQKYSDDLGSFIANVYGSKEVYQFSGLQENTLISFVEIDGLIEAHKLDIILPTPGTEFFGFLK